MANTGIGATLVFSGGITFSGRWRSISGLNMTVESLDDTALNSTDYMEACPDDLISLDPVDITLSATLVGSGFLTSATLPELAVGQKLDGSIQIKFDGKTGPAFTPAS